MPNFDTPMVNNSAPTRSAVVADFTDDGIPDVITGTNLARGGFTMFEGDGSGAFPRRVSTVSLGAVVMSIAAGDFRGDGRVGIVTANGHNGFGNASVNLRPALCCRDDSKILWDDPGAASSSTSVAAADFNADGKADVVVTNSTYHAIYVALSEGAGLFGSKKVFNSGGVQPAYVKVGEFNNDGKLDLAVANSTSGNVAILLGDGAGGFGAATTYLVGSSPVSIATGDFNGDGKADLAVVNNGSQNISVLLGNGAGGFGAATNFSSGGTSPNSVAGGDFNSDGKFDLAVINNQEAKVAILTGNGAGSFSLVVSYATGATDPEHVSANDLNGDGRLDLVVAHESSGKLSVMLNTCGAAETAALSFSTNRFAVFEGSGSATITVRRTGLLSTPVTVNYVIEPENSTPGTDFTPVSGTLTFASGETTKTFSVPVADDTEVEGFEGVTLRLSAPTGGAILGIPATAALFILDNDSCSYFINTASRNSPAGGETVTVDVTALAGCNWTAVTSSGFVSVTSGASGTGNGQVVLTVSPNGTGALRSGSVTIAGQTFIVNQAAFGTESPSIRFSQPAYQLVEGAVGRMTLTAVRTGDTSAAASVDYRTADTDTFTVGCADNKNNSGGAYARCDFATTVGRLEFAAGETQKTFTVPIIDDAHVETTESLQVVLSNLTGGAPGATSTTSIVIFDNDEAGAPNPVTTSHQFFVRQQYLDFLSREPDTDGFNAWLGVLSRCTDANTGPSVPSGCDRIYVSGEGFFRSQEFQLKGFYVFRFYRAAFNRLPEYPEIVSDMSFVAGQTAAEVFARKAQLATQITQRAEFQTAYGGMTNAQYVAALLGRYNLTQIMTPDPAQPDGTSKVTLTSAELAGRLDAGTMTRAQVLRAVADSDEAGAQEVNNAFVGMQYYGYLRRKPDDAGFRAWLRVLQAGDVRTMVNGFLNSAEYRLRFGQQ